MVRAKRLMKKPKDNLDAILLLNLNVGQFIITCEEYELCYYFDTFLRGS